MFAGACVINSGKTDQASGGMSPLLIISLVLQDCNPSSRSQQQGLLQKHSKFIWVLAHFGIRGNQMAAALAKE